MDLPDPGGPTNKRLCPASRSDLQRALGAFLALDVGKVRQIGG